MSLNIKNPRVHELAKDAALRTGKTQTGVIQEALERYVEDLPGSSQGAGDREARLTWLVEDIRRRLRNAGGEPLNTDELYDQDGLPR